MSFRGEHPFSGMPPNKSIRGLVDSYYLKTHYLKFAHKITRILPRMQIIFLKKPYVPPKWRNLSFQIRVCPLFQIRFEGDDFMIELTRDELSRCQIGTLNIKRGQNIKYLPFAFTELGVAMLSSVLKSPAAIKVNRDIMRAFVAVRQMVSALPKPDVATDVIQLRKDFEELKLDIEDILHDQNDINESTRAQLDAISTALAELQAKPSDTKTRKPIGFIQPEDDDDKK